MGETIYLEPRAVYDGAIVEPEEAYQLIEHQYLNEVAGYLPHQRPSMSVWLGGRVIYSAQLIVSQLVNLNDWSEAQALEHLSYNIMGSYHHEWPIILEDV